MPPTREGRGNDVVVYPGRREILALRFVSCRTEPGLRDTEQVNTIV